MWLDDYKSAAIYIEKALELAPGNPNCLMLRASIREVNGDRHGCLADCARIAPKGKLGAQMRKLSTIVHIRSANFQAANDIISKLPKRIRAGSVDAVALAILSLVRISLMRC
jgi:hypothetical protein